MCVYTHSVSVGRVPMALIITGASDMSQFPHLVMTCPRPGRTEQMQQDVCVKVCVCVRLCMSVFISVCVCNSKCMGECKCVFVQVYVCVCVYGTSRHGLL